MSRIYYATSDFQGDFSLTQLLRELTDAGFLVERIDLEDEVITIVFNELVLEESIDIIIASHVAIPVELTAEVEKESVVITSEKYVIKDFFNNVYVAERSNFNIMKGMHNDVAGIWTPIVDNMDGFNITTGIYTATENGIYSIRLDLTTVSANTNQEINIFVKDKDDNVLYGKTEKLSLTSNPAYAFISDCIVLGIGDTLKFSISVDTQNIILNAKFGIFRIINY